MLSVLVTDHCHHIEYTISIVTLKTWPKQSSSTAVNAGRRQYCIVLVAI